MLYQHAELKPVLQCDCIVLLKIEVGAALCSHYPAGPSSVFWYNMLNWSLSSSVNVLFHSIVNSMQHMFKLYSRPQLNT